MNQSEQMIEQKSNDPRYMKPYLKIALDIEADVLLWSDALEMNQEALHKTNQEIEELQATKRDVDHFESTKESLRASMEERKAVLEKELEEELQIEKKKKTKRKIVLGLVFVLVAIVSYFALPLLLPSYPWSDMELPLRLLVSALFVVGVVIAFVPLFLALTFLNHLLLRNTYHEPTEFQSLTYRLAALERKERECQSNSRYVNTYLPQELQKQTFLVNRIHYIQKNLDEAKSLRDIIYSEGVLPQKYQNIVSVASLYQFLANGICTQIKGHGGIYDTYEYHVKLNEIITNLVEIRKMLHRIQANQEILYDKLNDIHDTLKDINSGIQNSANQIISNTAMTAEAAKRSAIAQEWRNRETWYRQ